MNGARKTGPRPALSQEWLRRLCLICFLLSSVGALICLVPSVVLDTLNDHLKWRYGLVLARKDDASWWSGRPPLELRVDRDVNFDDPEPPPFLAEDDSVRVYWQQYHEIHVLAGQEQASSLGEAGFTELIELAQFPENGGVRSEALAVLTTVGRRTTCNAVRREQILDVLARALKDYDGAPNCRAIIGLVQLKAKEKAPDLLCALRRLPKDLHKGTLGENYEEEWLIGALKEFSTVAPEPGHARVSNVSAEARLAHVPGSREAVPALRQALRKKLRSLSAMAIYVLGQVGPDGAAAVPDILQAQRDKPYIERSAALEWFQVSPEEGDIDRNAILALRCMGGACVPHLVEAFKDKDPKIRRIAASDLAELGPIAKPGIGPLRGLLKDPDAKVREAAAEALKKIEEAK